jgi:fatty acid desaturase
MVFEDWFWIVLASVLSWSAFALLPFSLSIPIYLLGAVPIIGARQRGLRVCNHVGTHGCLAKNKALNYLLSTVFAAWPTLESYSGYDDTHNSLANGHHLNLGTERDVDYQATVQQGVYREGFNDRDMRWHLFALPLQTPGYIRFLLTKRIWNPHENPVERTIRLIFVLATIYLAIALGWGNILLLYWFIPLFTTAVWIGLFVQLAEHYPLMELPFTDAIFVSRNRILSPWLNFYIGTHYEGYHLIHHLFPELPIWRMEEAHQILMQDPIYASLHQEIGFGALIKQLTPAKTLTEGHPA